MSNEYQVITLVLDDGTLCTFTGRAQIPSDCRVVDIRVTPPVQLPQGMTWDILPSGDDGVIDKGDA